MNIDDGFFYVWEEDDIDSSFFEATDDPQPLYVCSLCEDSSYEDAHVVRGYDPTDGIFERPGRRVEVLGGIDNPRGEYARDIERDLWIKFAARKDRQQRLATIARVIAVGRA